MRPDPSASRLEHCASHPVSWGWHVASVGLLGLAAVVNTWDWFATDRMPLGDFPGYAAQIQYVRDALLQHGRVPLWCIECYGGTTNFTSHLKEYLAFPLAVWGGPVLASKLLFAISRVVAALGLYLVVVRLFGAPLVGVIAGYAYGFGAIANYQNEHLDIALASALIPAILLASVELFRCGGARWALALGVLGACQFMNNWVHAATVPLAVGLLAAFRPWRERSAEPNPWRDRRLAARWALLAVGALGVFLVFAGSQLAWIASDARNHRLIPAGSISALRGIYIEHSPFLFLNRDNFLGPWLAQHHPPSFYDAVAFDAGRRYVGGVALALCIGGWLVVRRDERLRRWASVAGLMLLFQYWLSLGPRTLLWEVAGSLHWRPWVGRLLGAALLLFFPTYPLWNLSAQVVPVLEMQRSPGHFFDTAPFWFYLLFAVALVALQRSISRPRLARAVLAAVGLAVVVDFWPSTGSFSASFPMEPLRRAGEMVEGLPGDGGTLRLGLLPHYSPLGSWVAEQAPTGHAWGWLPWRAGKYWAEFLAAAIYSGPSAQRDGRLRLLSDVELLATARIRYLLLSADSVEARDPPPPWRLLSADEYLVLWEQPNVSPMALGYRAYLLLADEYRREAPAIVARALPENTLVVSPSGRLADATGLREGSRAILSPGGPALPQDRPKRFSSGGAWHKALRDPPVAPPFAVTYRRPQPEHIVLEAQAGPEPAMVFLSEGYHPWWRATVDSQPAPLLRAQVALMAVPVGPGSHVIDLRLERPVLVATADRLTGAAWIALALGAPGAALVHYRRAARR